MHILLVLNSRIPVHHYGGTERVVWYLGKELAHAGHRVSFLVQQGSSCNFANVIILDQTKSISDQIPESVDLVHIHDTYKEEIHKPCVYTIHGNVNSAQTRLHINSIFVSQNHALRHNAQAYIYNGLDWSDYGDPNLQSNRTYFHFLGNAAWRVKNVKGAIDIIKQTREEKLVVLGGNRLNFRMGFRFTLSPRVRFKGMIGGEEKHNVLSNSKGLIFPVRWNEPFGLAITESLYFGCPILATPYGSLPELVPSSYGVLSSKMSDLVYAAEHINDFDRSACHFYAKHHFDSRTMMQQYLQAYERVLNGEQLNLTEPKAPIIPEAKFLEWRTV